MKYNKDNPKERLQFFDSDQDNCNFTTGYPERNLEWFKKNILPDFLKRTSDGILLDIGCASGYFTKEFVPYFKTVIGVDNSKKRIDFASKFETVNLKFYRANLIEDDLCKILKYKIDLFFTNAVIPHINPKDKIKVFDNLSKIANENAKLFMYDGRNSSANINDAFITLINEEWLTKNIHSWKLEKSEPVIEGTFCFVLRNIKNN